MSTTKYEQVEFTKIIKDIKENRVVLPDFQRGFVWKDKNKQKALIASILTRIPIGSILLLETKGSSYKYKKIGMKNIRPEIDEDSKVYALIDGQQRITVLTAFLSDELISLGQESDFASPTLGRRYFLKFYSLERLLREPEEDIFGVKGFKASTEIVQSLYPHFSTEQVKEKIEVFNKSVNPVLKNASECDTDKLVEFCTSYLDDGMLLPLYYLYGSATKVIESHRDQFRAILKGIGEKYKNQYIELLANGEEDIKYLIADTFFSEKEILKLVKEDIKNNSVNIKNKESDLYKNISNTFQRKSENWADYVREYLEGCIKNMELYKIEVEETNIVRAIDIYQNLNLGGKALDVFDLLLARASLDENNKNLLEFVKDYVQENHTKEYQILIKNYSDEESVQAYLRYMKSRVEYSSLDVMGAIEKDGSLNSTFCGILMSIAGTLDYLTDDKGMILPERTKTITSRCTKSQQILSMDIKKIHIIIEKALIGFDRACFFMQIKCGIRTISEPRYRLMVVILGVILSEDVWYKNKKITSSLEAWYWAVLFSGSFRTEQNRAFQENLRKILDYILKLSERINTSPDFIISLCNSSFGDNRYNTEDILTMNNEFVEVDMSIADIICQYYLSLTYKDLLLPNSEKKYSQKQISVFSAYDKEETPLCVHRVISTGNSEQIYGKINSQKLEQKCKYNSPLNMIYISGKAHQIALKYTLDIYAKECDRSILKKVGFEIEKNGVVTQIDCESKFDEALKNRFKLLCSSIKKRYEKCLRGSEEKIDDFCSKS